MSTVSQGQVVTASQFNAIQNTVATVLGAGSGTTGYGQTVTSSQIAAGKPVTSAAWNLLQADINKCEQHQTGAAFSSGSLPAMTGVETASAFNLYDSATNTVNSNCLTAYAGNMTLTSSVATTTRATSWGSSSTPTISAQFYFDFTSNDTMRWFFNTGGQLRFVLAHPSTATTQDSNWNSALSALGTITFMDTTTTRSGTGGVPVAIGMANMTTTPQTIFSGTIGSGAYSTNSMAMTAYYGADNSILVITVSLTDNHTNTFYDQVASGTNCVASMLKSTVVMTGIETPAFGFYTTF
jgi:hypothetical protein